MLARLAAFLHANGRRVLVVAVIGAAVAGAFGFGVAKRLSPYGANDPATQSVQATNRFEAAAGRQIDAGIVALIRSGDVATAAARARVSQVATELRRQPDVAQVVTYYETHNAAMVSRDRDSTYALAYFKPLSDKALSGDFTATFALDLAYKDLHLALELGDELGVPLQMGASTHNLQRLARGMGLGKSDSSSVLRVYETLLKRTVKP